MAGVVNYVKRIVQLQRELEEAKKERRETAVVGNQPSVAQANDTTAAELQLAQVEIESLTHRLSTTESALKETKDTVQRLSTELQLREEDLIRAHETIREKNAAIQQLAIASRAGKEESSDPAQALRAAVAQNEALLVELQRVKDQCLRLQQQVRELEKPQWKPTLRISRPLTRVEIHPQLPILQETVPKTALCGVQEDYTNLHRRYQRLRDETGVSEEAAIAMGRVRELECKLNAAKELVALLRHDVEELFGWRVEFYGSSLLLTMKYSNVSLELVRNAAGQTPEYRLASSPIVRKSLQHPQATHFLTQAKSFPCYLAFLLLDFVANSHAELQY